MKFSDLKTLKFINFYRWDGGLPILLPFVLYIVFGISNIAFMSLSMKQLSVATFFAVWTAATLIFIKIAELLFFKQHLSLIEVFFMMLIMVGILGLKIYAVDPKY